MTVKAVKHPSFLLLFLATVLMFLSPPACSQQAGNTQPAQSARPGDVDTIEHLVSAAYDSFSGPPGPRDWERFRSLFYPGARLISTRRDNAGKILIRNLSVEEWIDATRPHLEPDGLFEWPTVNRSESWDHMAHVWSPYEARQTKEGKPIGRGINSFHLFNDGNRWWVLEIYWKAEDGAHPIPQEYLK